MQRHIIRVLIISCFDPYPVSQNRSPRRGQQLLSALVDSLLKCTVLADFGERDGEDERKSRDVLPLSRCPAIPLSRYPAIPLSRYPAIPLSRYPAAALGRRREREVLNAVKRGEDSEGNLHSWRGVGGPRRSLPPRVQTGFRRSLPQTVWVMARRLRLPVAPARPGQRRPSGPRGLSAPSSPPLCPLPPSPALSDLPIINK